MTVGQYRRLLRAREAALATDGHVARENERPSVNHEVTSEFGGFPFGLGSTALILYSFIATSRRPDPWLES